MGHFLQGSLVIAGLSIDTPIVLNQTVKLTRRGTNDIPPNRQSSL
jgi:hypothetical protein